MRRQHALLFAEIEPRKELLGLVLSKVGSARRRTARIRFAATTVGSVISGSALVLSVMYAVHEFYTSGFYDYLSLVFSSDNSLALAHWREFSLSLIESLPSFAVLLFLSVLFVFLWSLRGAIRNARATIMPVQAA